MTFKSNIAEQRFALDHVTKTASFVSDGDIVEAVLQGAWEFADGSWAPLNRAGDVAGAKWTEAGVTMPTGFPEAYRAYVQNGWGTIGVPEEHGGQGLPYALQTAVLEILGTANFSLALCPTLNAGAIEALIHHGSPDQKRDHLPRLVTGEWTGTMNLTEPQAGSEVGALRTKAEPRGDGTWSIVGTKIFISYGDHDMADNIVHLVLARTPDAPQGTRGISLFLVPKHRLDAQGGFGALNGVRVVSIEHKMGLHASPTCVLSFGDDGDCIGQLIGPVGGGMRAMFTMMNNARLNVGLQGVQIAEAATRAAIRYALERVQSARAGDADRRAVAIVEHPDVRRMLYRMKAQTQAARALVYYAAGMVDLANAGDVEAKFRLELLTPIAKAHATDIGCEVSSLGIQVHGGMGYVEETGAAQFFRDARIAPIYEGTNGIQAADLVDRKLRLDDDRAFDRLIAEMRCDVVADELRRLVELCQTVGDRLRRIGHDDRLAASYPFLTMLSTAVCGWLLEKQLRAAGADPAGRAKRSVVGFYLEQVVPEAIGLGAAASASSVRLYELTAEELAF